MPTRVNDYGQRRLFPIDLRDLAESIGLDWWAAKKLYGDNWLSFDPETAVVDNDSQESEFRFLGSLVAAGCDPRMLRRLLSGLERPYCYDLNRVCYDWTDRCWKDLPSRNPRLSGVQVIAELEEDQDQDGLSDIQNRVQNALNRLAAEAGEDMTPQDRYLLDPDHSSVVTAAQRLLWRLATSTLLDDASKVIAVGKMFQVFQRLPEVTPDVLLSVELSGPTRLFGTHEISHWWKLELDNGFLTIGAGGYFSRPETGGDSFTSMDWTAVPGREPETGGYVHAPSIVDDADTFEHEIAAIDFNADDYELTVWDRTLDAWM